MPDNTTHELHTRLSEKLQRQEELKSVIEKAVCDATGSRQPPLHRVDLTSDRIVKLSKAAELLIANSLSLDGNHKLVGECIREVYRVIEQNVGEMMKHLDRVADTDAQPQYARRYSCRSGTDGP